MTPLQPGDLIAERFRVEALLGEGGIARVYKVRHVRLGSVHALKQLTLVRPALADRLLLEGRIQAQLNHPNLVRVTDVVEHQGQPCLVMEYVAGTHLQALLHDEGAMPLAEALRLFTSVLSAVATAHDLGVLHRDLKPANILLSRSGDRWVPKVSDFGIAKIASGGLRDGETKAGVQLGTPGYMAPEQIEDSAQVDHRADIFALGAILYEVLSGQRPFQEDTTFRTLRATIEGRLVPLRTRLPTCPPAVAEAVHRCLQVEMVDRYQDCHALADALLADRPDLRGRVRRVDQQDLPEALHRPEAATGGDPPPAGPPSPAAHNETLSPDDEPVRAAGRPAAGLAPVNLFGAIAPDAEHHGEGARGGPSVVGSLSPAAANKVGPAGPRLAMGDMDEVTETVGPRSSRPLSSQPLSSQPLASHTLDDDDEPPIRPRRRGTNPVLWLGLAAGAAVVAGLAMYALRSGEPGEVEAPVPGATATDPEAPEQAPADGLEAEAQPSQAQPSQAQPSQAQPSQAQPSQAQPSQAQPSQAQPSQAQPSQAQPTPVAVEIEEVATEATAAPQEITAVEIGTPTQAPPEEEAVAEVSPEVEPELPPPTPPALVGSWSGTANDRPLTIRVVSQDGETVSGRLTFTQADSERETSFTGTVSAASNRVVLVEQGGTGLTFTGVVRGTGMMGTYGRTGKEPALSWSARKQ